MLGPLLAGVLVESAGYEHSFHAMSAISLAVLFLTWAGLKQKPAEGVNVASRL
jgi:hypothetical protein